MSFYALDLIGPAIDKTTAFFKGPGLKTKWIKIGILIMIFELLAGGGGGGGGPGFSTNNGSLGEIGPTIQSTITAITAETWMLIFTVAIVGFVLLFLVGIILTQLRNITFFAIVESLTTNKVMIIPYWKKFWGKAVSLTILQVILSLLSLPFVLALLFLLVAGLLLFFGVNTSVLGPFAILASLPALFVIGSITIIALLVFFIIGFLVEQFAMYWMYVSEIKAFEALKKSVGLVKQNILQVIVLIITKIVLGLVIVIVAMIAVLIIAVPLVIIGLLALLVLIPLLALAPILLIIVILALIFAVLIFAFVVNIILAPLSAFLFNYDLMFLKKLLGK